MFTLKPGINRDKFSVKEDCILMAAVKEFGTTFTKFPMHLLPGRTVVQIRNRYRNVLCNVGQRKAWTIDDDGRLMDEVERLGTSAWAQVAKNISFPRLSCRTRYNTIVNFLKRYPQSTYRNVPRRTKEMSTAVTADNWMEMIINTKPLSAPTSSNSYVKCSNADYVNRRYYEYFKFAYDFQYGANGIDDNNAKTTQQRQLFRILNATDDTAGDEHKLGLSQISPIEFDVPANWSTALLLRGICIMLPPRESNENASSTINVGKLDVIESLQKFRTRFKALLWNAMMLSKCTRAVGNDATSVAEVSSPNGIYTIETKAGQFKICVFEKVDIGNDDDAEPTVKRKRTY